MKTPEEYCDGITGIAFDRVTTAKAYADGIAALRAELEGQEAVAWISHDQVTSKDRYGPLPVQSLNPLGFKHTRLYAHPMPPPDVRELVDELKKLYRAYVLLLEAGRDRITQLGGDCDPVDRMESGDSSLRSAKAALAKFGGGV